MNKKFGNKKNNAESVATAQDFWEERFSSCETDCEPEADRWEKDSRESLTAAVSVNEEKLAALCRAAESTPAAFFTAAFAYLTAVFTGLEDVLFRTVLTGQEENVTIPFRMELREQGSIVSFVKQAENLLRESREHAGCAHPAEAMGLKLPLMFRCLRKEQMEEAATEAGEAPDVLFEQELPEAGACRVRMRYNSGRYSTDWAESFTGTYRQIVAEMLEKDSLQDLILVERDEAELLDSFNRTETPRGNADVVSMFRRAAAAFPDHAAIVTDKARYTYAETDRITDALAGYLREHGIGKGKVVSVLIPRNEYMPLVSFGVLKSGAAYQPLDPTYPEERLNFMVKDAEASLLIADRELAGRLKDWEGPVLFTDEIPQLPEADPFDAGIRPEDLFILLYTSGSTGTPKGTMLQHGNISELTCWAHQYFRMSENTCSGAYASYGFDAHMVELYPTLTCGGTLCIVPDEIRLDLNAIEEYFNRNGVTISQMTTQVGRQFALSYKGGSLKDLMVGGETLVPVDPAKLKVKLHNAYGPTECAVLVSVQPVDRLYHRVPIGKALDNVELYVVDRFLRRLPLFAPGELLIAGPKVSKGYLHLPEKTESVFISNPFSKNPADNRAYRTGDVVRMLSDGRFDFIGRRDSQVKVRGFRIELSEVETVIREYPGIHDATVQAFADEHTGMKYLAAYVVSDNPVDIQALKEFIRERKPPYMVPAVTMQLDAIPLTQNQKVNRKKLPLPKREAQEYEKPATEDEELAFRCAAEAVGHVDFGVTTDLEEAGLSSIGAMQLNVLLAKAFRRSVRFSAMKALHSVREIAAYFRTAAEEKSYALQKLYPLSTVQQGVYVDCLSNPQSTTYNLPFLARLDPAVDIPRLKAALRAAVNAHPYMKARLTAAENGETLAERHDEEELLIDEVEKSELPFGFSSLVRPFRLTEEALVRIVLIRDGPSCWLFFDPHHLVFDGESLNIFFRDLEKAYAGESLEKESFTGFEAALAEKELRAGPAYGKAKAYYASLLEGRDTDCLPVRDRNLSKAEAGFLSREVSVNRHQVEHFLQESRSTANALWNAAFGLTLSRFLARNDCVYATVYNGRNDSRLADSVGMFVHTLPVVFDLQNGEDARNLIARMGRQLTDSMSNDVFSFSEISREFGLKPGILFVYEGAIGEVTAIGGRPAETTSLQPNAAKEEMTFYVYDTEEGYRIECEYEASHYEEWHINSLMKSMEAAVMALLRNEKTDSISLLTKQDQDCLASFNSTEKPVEDTDIVTLFRRSASKYPDRVAVIYGDTQLTYRETDDLSNRVAAYLRNLGVGAEDAVSVLIPRSEYMAVAALGVLKAGAAYQPLDPSYPTERLQYMVSDSKAKVLIADAGLTHLLPDYSGSVLRIQDIPSLPESTLPDPELTGDNLFILLYTSGTTGMPKGVMLEHRNLVNFCDWYRTYYDLTPDSIVAAYASFGFDACMMDLWPALTTGAAVCIVPENLRLNLPELNRFFEEKGVTHVFMTTQMGRMFAGGIPKTTIRHLSVGGEKLVPLAPPEGYVLTNGYGPTECTIFSTAQPVDRLYERIPIGSPLSNYKLYVTDRSGSELPVGAIGELWIAGYGVGRGYLNQREATERVFTANPFSTDKGFSRVFRTGDLVRRLADGRIDFIGRNDGQVKVRGFRIELAEVEGVIREFPDIRDVTVQAFDNETAGGKYIAAYVVSDKPVDFARLSDFIRSKKPPYMVPAAWMQLDAIPLNQNQKVNRRALPLPVAGNSSDEFVEPETPLEKEICDKFAEILGQQKVSVTDSFFDLGGSSISAAQIVMFAMNRGYPIVYKDVFAHSSARELAQLITGAKGGKRSEAAADYDYTAIHDLLSVNTMELVEEISARQLGNVVLAGATGFLGIHVLKTYLDSTDGQITCLMRRGRFETPEKRLKTSLVYYFGDTFEQLFGNRIFCVEGDITDPDSLKKLDTVDAGTVINCAASVKHFVKDDLLDRINTRGVENLIEVCLRNSMRLVQISTLSVGGDIEPEHAAVLKENMLYFGQNVDNDYVRTKFLAERAILNARVQQGLDAVILRAGNLMGRHSDGEFQMNFKTNSFMRSLWAYVHLGVCPVTILDQPIEFSPIDSVANAVIKLAGADSRFSVFHMYNNHTVTMADLIGTICRHGFEIKIVSEAQFRETLSEAAKHGEESNAVLSLVAYNNEEGENLIPVDADGRFSVNALFRLNFRWPIIDEAYLEKVLSALDTLGFFTGKL